MDAFVSAVLLGIFHVFPVPVSDLPLKLEYLPAHSVSIRSEVSIYRMTGTGELEKRFTRNFLDTSRTDRERTAYHLDSAGNVTAWEEYGVDSLPVTRGATIYSDGRLKSASYTDTSGRIFRSESYTWSHGELQAMEIILTDAETTSTVFEYDQGRMVKYRTQSDGPGSFTVISYPSPDTIRGEEYRDSLLTFATVLIFANGRLAKVQYQTAVANYFYGDNIAIRTHPSIRTPALRERYDALGRGLGADRIGHSTWFVPGTFIP